MGTAPAVTPDFGTAGTVTDRTDDPAVAVHVSNGEYLDLTLTTNAPAPAFSFTCKHRPWASSSDHANPQATYSWALFQNGGRGDAPNDTYVLTLLFYGAPASYTFIVVKRDKNGNAVSTLKDLDFSSDNPADFVTSSFRVFLV